MLKVFSVSFEILDTFITNKKSSLLYLTHYSLAVPEMPSIPEIQVAFKSPEITPIYNASLLIDYRIFTNSESFLFLNQFYFFPFK